jgi:peptidase M28-like protein
MKFTIALLSSLFAIINGTAQNSVLNKLVESVTETSLKTTLFKIAGSQFEGRMAGSKGDNLAIDYISNWFSNHHLINPCKKTTPYLQSVPLIHSNYSTSTLAIDGKSFVLDSQWTYLNGSKSFNATSADIAFIGYGISTTNFDELKGIDIEGKIIVTTPEFPNISNGKSIIEEKDMPNPEQRIMNILSKKPLAILIYSPQFINDLNELKYWRRFALYYKQYQDHEIPPIALYPISSDIGNYIIDGNIDSLYNSILQTGKPKSFNTHKKITLSINKEDEPTNTANLVGIIKGTNENLPCIVFSAHHDHEGIVDNLTYFGADDNGSGTAALLEISKILGDVSAKGIRPKRTIVFVSTAAEEQGLIGGYFYVEHPVIPLSKTYCNINVDMLGRVDSFYTGKRVDSNYIYCMYHDSSKNIFNSKKLQRINKKYSQLKLDTLYDAESKVLSPYSLIARSDNFPFMQKSIPAIWFFSGFHKDYHQPTDTPDKINYPLFKRRTQLALATLWQLANE